MTPVTEPKTSPLNLRLPEPLKNWLEQEAQAEALTISEFVRYLLLNAKRGESR